MKKRLPGFLLDWALIVLGVTGALLCLTSSFRLPVPPALLPGTALAAALLCGLFRLRRGGWIALGLTVLALGALWLRREAVGNSFLALWNHLAAYYVRGYAWMERWYYGGETLAGVDTALWILAGVQVFLAALSLVRWKRISVAVLILVLGAVPCFVLTDTPPDLGPFLLLCLSLLVLALSQSARGRGEELRGVAWGTLGAALLLGLLLLLWPQKDFKPPLSWDELAARLSELVTPLENKNLSNAGLTGNPSEIDLSSLSKLPDKPKTVLTLTAEKYVSGGNQHFYLRGSAYRNFDGTRWTRGSAADWSAAAVYPYLGSDNPAVTAMTGRVRVHAEVREPQLYSTYDLTALPEGAVPVGDAFLRNTEALRDYTLDYYSPRLAVSYIPPFYTDDAYEAWVRENYLDLPDETREAVLAWWDAQRSKYDIAYGGSWEVVLAHEIADAVKDSAVYSRAPEKLPEGRDFCDWFLNDATEGYCVHFATAATALLRAQGIPARYVSGYVCDLNAGGVTEVTTLHAHAWTEAWLNGKWTVIEPTPAEATEFTGTVPSETRPTPTAPARTVEPTEPTVPTRPTEDPDATREVRPTEPRATEPGGPGEGPGTAAPTDLGWLWIPGAPLGLLLLLLLRRRLTLALRRRRMDRAGPNEKALLLWRQYEKLCKLCREDPAPRAGELANRAAFSQHTLTEDELRVLRHYLGRAKAELNRKTVWKRIWYRYIRCVY